MAIDTNSVHSRRVLLAAAASGAAALAATALEPLAVRATNGDSILVGNPNTGTAVTTLTNTAPGGVAFNGIGGIGLVGTGDLVGVRGEGGSSGTGVHGESLNSAGVSGVSGTGIGITGFGAVGVNGEASGSGTGVKAVNSSGGLALDVQGRAQFNGGPTQFNGGPVMFLAPADFNGPARFNPPAPVQFMAEADFNGPAHFMAEADFNVLARFMAEADFTGPAHFMAPADFNGPAQFNNGPVGFNSLNNPVQFRRSGLLSIPAGSSSATQLGIPLTSTSLILATLQTNVPGIFVQAAVPNVSVGSFMIILSKSARVPTTVAWFVIG